MLAPPESGRAGRNTGPQVRWGTRRLGGLPVIYVNVMFPVRPSGRRRRRGGPAMRPSRTSTRRRRTAAAVLLAALSLLTLDGAAMAATDATGGAERGRS